MTSFHEGESRADPILKPKSLERNRFRLLIIPSAAMARLTGTRRLFGGSVLVKPDVMDCSIIDVQYIHPKVFESFFDTACYISLLLS